MHFATKVWLAWWTLLLHSSLFACDHQHPRIAGQYADLTVQNWLNFVDHYSQINRSTILIMFGRLGLQAWWCLNADVGLINEHESPCETQPVLSDCVKGCVALTTSIFFLFTSPWGYSHWLFYLTTLAWRKLSNPTRCFVVVTKWRASALHCLSSPSSIGVPWFPQFNCPSWRS